MGMRAQTGALAACVVIATAVVAAQSMLRDGDVDARTQDGTMDLGAIGNALNLQAQEVAALSLAALAVLVSAGGKIDGGGVIDVIYVFALQLGPTVGCCIFRRSACPGDLALTSLICERRKRSRSRPRPSSAEVRS